MKATTENLIALGVGYVFNGKKTVFNLEELLEVFKGASYQESDVQEIPSEDGLTSVEYIDVKNVNFENAKFVQPEVVEEKEESLPEEKEAIEEKTVEDNEDKKIEEPTDKKEEVKEVAKVAKTKTPKTK